MKLGRLVLITVLMTFCIISFYGQAKQRTVSLLVAVCDNSKKGCDTQQLYRYTFRKGKLISKNLILTTNVDDFSIKASSVHLYQNRYLIVNDSRIVDLVQHKSLNKSRIIDIYQNKLLFKVNGNYGGVKDNMVLFTVEDDKGKNLYGYDLNSRKYTRLEMAEEEKPNNTNSFWQFASESPDGTKRATSKFSNGELWIIYKDGKEELLGSDFTNEPCEICSSRVKTPFVWLDDARIITQKGNGHLFIVNINKTIEPLFDIQFKRTPTRPAYFSKNLKGQIIYSCDGESFVIDVARKNFTPYLWHPLANGFEISEDSATCGETVRYQGKNIGCWTLDESKTEIIPDYFATVTYKRIDETFLDGSATSIKVWGQESNLWTSIDDGWAAEILCWIEN